MLTEEFSIDLLSPDSRFSLQRPTSAWHRVNAVYKEFTTDSDYFDNEEGLVVEPAATNVCTNYNANPDASLTHVSTSGGTLSRVRSSLLFRSGLADICSSGYVWQIENNTTSQVVVTISGQVGTTNMTAISLFAYTQDSGCQFQLTGGDGATIITPTPHFVRFQSENIAPGAPTDQFQLLIPTGATLQWVLNQVESAGSGSKWGVTSPIITAGSGASRSATYGYCDLPAGLSTSDFMVIVDVKCASSSQYNDSSNILQTNGATDRLYATTGMMLIVDGATNARSDHRMISAQTWQRIAVRQSGTTLRSWTDGKPSSDIATYSGGVDLSSSRLFIGIDRATTATSGFNGRIRKIKIYSGISDDAVAIYLTAGIDYSMQITDTGLPFYGQDKNLYALLWNSSIAKYDRIGRSSDNGLNWQLVHTLSLTKPTAGFATLTRDSSGNFYIANSNGLIKIDSGGNESQVITWNTSSGTPTYSWISSWAWGEQDDGTLYTAPYNGHNIAVGNAWMYKSTDSGDTWSEHNITDFFPGETNVKHIHHLKISPVDNMIYGSWGDLDRGSFVSLDLSSATQISGASGNDGPTDVTFDQYGNVHTTDQVGATNYIDMRASPSVVTARTDIPRNTKISPIYNGRMRNDKELVTHHLNEGGAVGQGSCLLTWSCPYGIRGPLEITRVIHTPDQALSETNLTRMAGDQYGQVPEWSEYVYLYGVDNNTPLLYRYRAYTIAPA